MQRDDEYIRELLFEAENAKEAFLGIANSALSTDLDRKRYAHAVLLTDAGFFQQQSSCIFRLTNQGYDYLASIKDDGIWQKTKEAAKSIGGVSLPVLMDIAIAYGKKELSQRFNLSF